MSKFYSPLGGNKEYLCIHLFSNDLNDTWLPRRVIFVFLCISNSYIILIGQKHDINIISMNGVFETDESPVALKMTLLSVWMA